MPLSEHEQRLLEQLEKQLHEDHRFASNMKSAATSGAYSTRNLALGALLAVAGVIVLIWSISSQLIPVGVVGFAMMFAGVYLAISRKGRSRGKAGGTDSPVGPKSNFMTDLEHKWEQRKREDS